MRALPLSTLILLVACPTASMAQGCLQMPEGPARFACMSNTYPAFERRLERCKEKAYDMGLRPGAGRGNGPAFKGYVQACMHRRG
jgi:hypothetical protein